MTRFLKLSTIGLLLLSIFLVLPQHVQAQTRTSIQTTPYSVLGRPTVSAAFINQVLAAYHSPAAGKGQALYDDGVQYGIDPAFALAFFMHESSFGTAGVARQTLSLGNIRCIPGNPCIDGFTVYASWEDGFVAWYQLIDDLYVHTWGLTTVEQIIPRYAPASDNNDEQAYIAAVESSVDAWRSQNPIVVGSAPTTQTSTTSSSTSISSPSTSVPQVTYAADGYSITGKPTVSAAFIDHILTLYHSPVAGKGQVIYDAGVKYGIDPAFTLAFFMHESLFGTRGMAPATRAIGRIPMSDTADCQCQDFHGYRSYSSWDDGITDWYRFVHDQYVAQGFTTVSQVVAAYSTSKDPRVLRMFIRTVEQRIDTWRTALKDSPTTN